MAIDLNPNQQLEGLQHAISQLHFESQEVTSGQSYTASMLVNYDSRVKSTSNLLGIMTLEL